MVNWRNRVPDDRVPDENGEWKEYRRLVLDRLTAMEKRLDMIDGKWAERFDLMEARMRENEMEVVAVKIKAGMWGAIAGMLPSLIYLAGHAIKMSGAAP